MNETMLRNRLSLLVTYHSDIETAKDKLIAGYEQLLDAAAANSNEPNLVLVGPTNGLRTNGN